MCLDKIKNIIKLNEGFRKDVYLDHLGVKTIGYGRNINNTDFNVGDEVPEDILNEWFEEDFDVAHKDALTYYGKEFPNDSVKLVLIDMSFQLGLPRLSKFVKFKAALLREDYEDAIKNIENSLLRKQTPNRVLRNIKHLERLL